jgi:ring-1,2-phenylacetyl-CoA epoxidase subunit PaaC
MAGLEPLLATRLLALADDEMILAHRDSEWTGHAPILEEDIAFTNVAVDEMGHAWLWYRLHAGLVAQDPEAYPDELVFQREAPFFTNVQLVELPRGDWAVSMLRQYLFDAAEAAWLPDLSRSSYAPLAEVAIKVAKEEIYHLRHTQSWVRRLSLGTDESHRRMQAALDQLWPYALQLWEPVPGDGQLESAGWLPGASNWGKVWTSQVGPLLKDCGLTPPEPNPSPIRGRQDHSEHLVGLLTDMQSVARAHPGAAW